MISNGVMMNRISKKVTVQYLSIETESSFFSNFNSSYSVIVNESHNLRIRPVRNKKHLLKLSDSFKINGIDVFPISIVRERNTWQLKALRDGSFSGISGNQGIVGDPYYFLVVPEKKLLLGMTTGPNDSIKSVGLFLLDQFKFDRTIKLKLSPIAKEKDFSKLEKMLTYESLHFKVETSSLQNLTLNAPKLIKELSASPYITSGIQLTLDINFDESTKDIFSKDEIFNIVTFLSDFKGCNSVKIKCIDDKKNTQLLDFGNSFHSYRSTINIRKKFIDEESSLGVLVSAFEKFTNGLN